LVSFQIPNFLAMPGDAVRFDPTPHPSHRLQGLQRVWSGTYPFGASQPGNPLRLMNFVPDNTGRSSARGLPWDFGTWSSRPAISTFVSRTSSVLLPCAFRVASHKAAPGPMGTEPRMFQGAGRVICRETHQIFSASVGRSMRNRDVVSDAPWGLPSF
jgi:hypothetical protein